MRKVYVSLSDCVPTQRKPISRHLRGDVWSMSNGHCWYCGLHLNPFRDFVVEHVIPLCRGGADDITNMVPACAYCNECKGIMTPDEWLPFFADSMGQGLDPAGWIYWHQLPRGMEMPGGNGRGVFKKYEHCDWRELVIKGHFCAGDDE